MPSSEETVAGLVRQIGEAVQGCRRCELWRDATQGVPGEGPVHARLMLVGEQPGDLEDLAGRPFVGPAGRMLRAALAEAGVDAGQIYLTNAVKHFKHKERGERRLHKTPRAGEVNACRWWLDQERRLIRPRAILALGATAAQAVFGRPTPVMTSRGRPATLGDGVVGLVTVHPSYLLRAPDHATRDEAYRLLVSDLALGWACAIGTGPDAAPAATPSPDATVENLS